MKSTTQKSVLITGCSSGIGHALAVEFFKSRYRVFATARKIEALADLERLGIEILGLDVDDPLSIKSAIDHAIGKAGRIDLLINNAGFLLAGPVAELSIDDIRRQFETNVIGAVAVSQAVIPHMVRQGSGGIVNVGSPSGILVTPFGGVYGGSKAALHIINEAMRMELKPFGIEVILLLPGAIKSHFAQNAVSLSGPAKSGSLYASAQEGIRKRVRMTQEKSTPTEVFAAQVVKALSRDNPSWIIQVGRGASLLPLLKRVLPDWLLDHIRMRRFNLSSLQRHY